MSCLLGIQGQQARAVHRIIHHEDCPPVPAPRRGVTRLARCDAWRGKSARASADAHEGSRVLAAPKHDRASGTGRAPKLRERRREGASDARGFKRRQRILSPHANHPRRWPRRARRRRRWRWRQCRSRAAPAAQTRADALPVRGRRRGRTDRRGARRHTREKDWVVPRELDLVCALESQAAAQTRCLPVSDHGYCLVLRVRGAPSS